MPRQFLIDLVAQGRFQYDTLTVTKKRVFTHVPWKEFVIHAKYKERPNRPATGGHGIQHLNTLMPVLFDGHTGLVQYPPEQFDPFLP